MAKHFHPMTAAERTVVRIAQNRADAEMTGMDQQ
jgi:hypothetical protein